MVRDIGIALCVTVVSACGLVVDTFAAFIAARNR